MLKKSVIALVSVFILAAVVSCGMIWFGALEGFEFEAEYEASGGLIRYEIDLKFETSDTGTLRLGESAYAPTLGGWIPPMYTTWDFTYEYDFQEEAGTIRRTGASAINFTTRNSPPNLEVVLQGWPQSGSNAVVKMVTDSE